jgi:hypothetical protein
MTLSPRSLILLSMLAYLLSLVNRLQSPVTAEAAYQPQTCLRADAVRPGMRGHASLKAGTMPQRSCRVEILSLVRNVGLGREMVLCRLSPRAGDTIDFRTALAGSAVYIGDKLLGTAACVNCDGGDTVAGVAPFWQPLRDVIAPARQSGVRPSVVHLPQPIRVGVRDYNALAVGGEQPQGPAAKATLWLSPLLPSRTAPGSHDEGMAIVRRRNAGGGL